MTDSLVAVVGRPNVGKSTFFNKIAGKRVSIVKDTPGVTRDRIYMDCEWLGRRFTLIDTGGLEPNSDDLLPRQIRRQAEIAIESCDVILFFVDGRAGLTSEDEDIATLLRKSGKPVIPVVNKVDFSGLEDSVYDFYALGLGEPIAISSTNMLGLGDLLDRVLALLPKSTQTGTGEAETVQIAVVGRPNVGKSSLVNRILGQERTMVSDVAGTTRDAIDSGFTRNGRRYTIIDTAGIRRKRSIEEESIERYSILRSLDAVRRCNVALLLIDAESGVTEQDTKIAGFILEAGKACVIVVNKWDAVEKDTGTLEKKRKEILSDLKFMDYAPVVFISALTGQRVPKVLDTVDEVHASATKRITTGLLNDVLNDAQAAQQPPYVRGRQLRIYYATQSGTEPPSFILFVNDEELMHFTYERYLENQLRKTFGFEGTPIRFILRNRKGDEER
ncbi:MAG: ribosome biogenesis GTPase Der [Clostridiales bacterium]|nr:ribosome biogenesis GTPase Der [Clostridiales bacterium]